MPVGSISFIMNISSLFPLKYEKIIKVILQYGLQYTAYPCRNKGLKFIMQHTYSNRNKWLQGRLEDNRIRFMKLEFIRSNKNQVLQSSTK